jgi:hypothetical protein
MEATRGKKTTAATTTTTADATSQEIQKATVRLPPF